MSKNGACRVLCCCRSLNNACGWVVGHPTPKSGGISSETTSDYNLQKIIMVFSGTLKALEKSNFVTNPRSVSSYFLSCSSKGSSTEIVVFGFDTGVHFMQNCAQNQCRNQQRDHPCSAFITLLLQICFEAL